ncbi:DinB family protein [Alsobacter sp. SYSU BS001988]
MNCPRIRSFAGYNAWANRRLYDAAARLDDADYRADRGAFFRSVHGTLNHLLAADRIWMRRFTGEGDAPKRLDVILHDRLEDLRRAREAEDARIVAFAQGLTEERLAGSIRYARVTTGEVFAQPLAPALDHFFNHQTHHRGQVHALLTGLGAEAPELDLLFYHRESGEGASVKVGDVRS